MSHGDKIAKAIVEEGAEFVTWVVDAYSDNLWIRQARPRSTPDNLETEDPDAIFQELERRHTHDLAALNGELDRMKTSLGQADVLPTAIIVDQLRVVVQARRVEGRHPCVDRADIETYVSNSSLNYTEERVTGIVSNLIEAGKRINFLSEWDDERADLKIVSNYTSKDDLEQVLEDKWIDWRIEDMQDDLRDKCEERITAELGRQKRLTEYGLGLPEEEIEENSE